MFRSRCHGRVHRVPAGRVSEVIHRRLAAPSPETIRIREVSGTRRQRLVFFFEHFLDLDIDLRCFHHSLCNITLEALQGQLLHKARPAFTPAEVKAAIVHLPNEAARLLAQVFGLHPKLRQQAIFTDLELIFRQGLLDELEVLRHELPDASSDIVWREFGLRQGHQLGKLQRHRGTHLHDVTQLLLGSQDLEEFGSQKFVQQHDVHFILQTLR
mmetsp:Transcript_58642/g.128334  ORF Transcript_58642/g.128334 Transcript_58642/m.128334 type:complete len:213 (+) Transcript_58642:350-988(+)